MRTANPRDGSAHMQRRCFRTRLKVAVWTNLLVSALLALSSCDKSNRLKKGMDVREVEAIMGTPARVVDDPRRFHEELASDPTCAAAATEILVFNTRRDKHVHVGVNRGKVICVVRTEDVIY